VPFVEWRHWLTILPGPVSVMFLLDPAVGSDEGDRGEGAKYAGMKGFADLADLLRQGLQG
jgi:hypothetical protein